MRTTTTTTIIREDELEDGTVIGEHEIDIEATYYAGRSATYLEPEDYPEVEITRALIGHEEVELTEEEEELAIQKILEDPPHDY